MRSFDFYDTLVIRLVATPADIFSLVGERLRISGFRTLRIAAESAARREIGGEVTFKQIYDHIPLAAEIKAKAQALEYEFELSLVVPVAAVLPQLQTGDLIVSDMYHDQALYEDLLRRFAPGVVPAAYLISGLTKTNKASGRLWKHVAAEYPTHGSHIGDNLLSDVRQARKAGLIADHYLGAVLNRYEVAILENGDDGSIIAGVSRATRVSLTSKDTNAADAATIEVFASVIGPLLHSFGNWILEACEQQGIQDIYFFARDGQLPFRICSQLVSESNRNLHCHYIFASRQALHLPGCKSIEDAATWLLEDTPHLSLSVIAQRASVPIEVVVVAARAHINVGPEDNIPHGQRHLLAGVIRSPTFVAAFEISVNQAFEAAAAYYLRQGLGAGGSVAVVDVGWNGRLQRSLGMLLEKAGSRPARMLGLYLCLSRRLSTAPGDDLRGFVADPERPALAAFFDQYRHVFEAVLSADHPTTIGFEFKGREPQAILGGPYPPSTRRRIEIQHATLNQFFANLGTMADAAGRAIRPSNAVSIQNFKQFISRPSPANGLAFEGFLFVDGQSGHDAKPITRTVTASDLANPSIDLGFWPEGTLSGSGFGYIIPFRRLSRWLLRSSRFVKRWIRNKCR